jgi:hypothetical protein
MRKIKSVVAAAAVAAGMLASPLAAGTANAANAALTYTISYIQRCATVSGSANKDCFKMGTYSTYSQTQVWINGRVFCNPYSGSVTYSWCGVGGGNGTGALNIGINFTFSGVGGLYERMNIYAGFAGCSTWGSSSPKINGYDFHWWNDTDNEVSSPPGKNYNGVVCEYPA